MDKNLDKTKSIIFRPKHNYLESIVVSLAILVIIIGISTNGPGIVNSTVLLVSFTVAIVVFLFLIATTPRSKITLNNNHIYYKRKSIDLTKLAEVNQERTILIYPRAISADFRLKLIDNNKNSLSIPYLGTWDNQDVLIEKINKYAKESGATMNNRAIKLFENTLRRSS